MQLIHVIILSVVQGISELFPISSLGHTIIIESFLDIKELSKDSTFVPFIVALHLGTAAALVVYFHQEWSKIVKGFIKTMKIGSIGNTYYERLPWLLIVGTIPVGVIGLFLENPIKQLFTSPFIVGVFLICNGLILFIAEKIKQHMIKNPYTLDTISFKQTFIIGLSQSFALLPGISRSGISMATGLLYNLSHEEAAYFSFMLATPVIAAAGALEIPQLFTSNITSILYAILGATIAGIVAYLSVKFLMHYFEKGNLYIYAYYSFFMGIAALIYFH